MVTPQSSVSMQQQNEAPYRNRTLPIEKRVDDLLGRMTLDEKIGQMTQADHASLQDATEVDTLFLGIGAERWRLRAAGWHGERDGRTPRRCQKRALGTRLGIPLIYGIDAVHGHSNVSGASIFPHNIGLGCARNPKLVEEIGQRSRRARWPPPACTGRSRPASPCRRTSAGAAPTRASGDTGAGRAAWAGGRARAAGHDLSESRPRAGVRQTLRRRRRHAHAASTAATRPATKRRCAPFICAGYRHGDRGGRRIDHGVVQQLERREDARPSNVCSPTCSGASCVSRGFSSPTGMASTSFRATAIATSNRRSTPASTWSWPPTATASSSPR